MVHKRMGRWRMGMGGWVRKTNKNIGIEQMANTHQVEVPAGWHLLLVTKNNNLPTRWNCCAFQTPHCNIHCFPNWQRQAQPRWPTSLLRKIYKQPVFSWGRCPEDLSMGAANPVQRRRCPGSLPQSCKSSWPGWLQFTLAFARSW